MPAMPRTGSVCGFSVLSLITACDVIPGAGRQGLRLLARPASAALGVPARTARTRPALRARRYPEGADPQRVARRVSAHAALGAFRRRLDQCANRLVRDDDPALCCGRGDVGPSWLDHLAQGRRAGRHRGDDGVEDVVRSAHSLLVRRAVQPGRPRPQGRIRSGPLGCLQPRALQADRRDDGLMGTSEVQITDMYCIMTVRDHGDHGGHREAQPPDARHTAHDIGVGRDPLERHAANVNRLAGSLAVDRARVADDHRHRRDD